MKRKIALIMFSLISLSYLISCIPSLPSKPSVSVQFQRIKKISLIKKSITLDMLLNIYNPYPVGGNVEYIKANLFIENNTLTKIRLKNPKIVAKGTANNPFTLKLKFKDLLKIYKDMKNRDTVRYTVQGEVGVKIPGYGVYPLKFNHNGTLPAIYISLSVKRFKVSKIRFSALNIDDSSNMFPGISFGRLKNKVHDRVKKHIPQASIDVFFDLVLTNKAKSLLRFSNLQSNFYINGYHIIEGASGSPVVQKDNQFIYRVKNTLKINNTVKALFRKRRGNYKWVGSFILHLPAPFGDHKVEFSRKGKLSW